VVLETWEDMNQDFQLFGPDAPQSAEALRRLGEVIDTRVPGRKKTEAVSTAGCSDMAPRNHKFDFDFIVIGSGFGGSVSAHRLVEKGYTVGVMEMGRRWTPGNLPHTSWSIHRWFWRPELGLRGFFNMRFFRHVTIFHGCAVGGGSITYASTLLPPSEKVWESGSWTGLADWKTEMPRHYETAARTDPFFGGDGPERSTCIACGGCMMGCRHGAKNTLDLSYLHLAEKHGAHVFPETKVVDVTPLDGVSDGSAGYEVCTVRSTAWIQRQPRRFTCRAVVFSASSLGTMELLFHLKEKGSLPAISSKLGQHVRTNSESLIGARTPGYSQDLSQGIAIGSGIYIDEHTHIEAVRYPSGSDTMGFLTTILTDGRPGPRRIALWLKNVLGSLLRHPFKTVRVLQPWGWAREFVILLCMQALDGEIEMCWQRPWFWPFRKFLVSRGEKVPTYIPKANEFAKKFAQLTGGFAMSMLPEILFDVPGTAHCIGGCVIADSPGHGVVDARHRVFGYKNMYVCDGSVVAANLGVNPSLTITALAERAMSFIPPATLVAWNGTAEDPGEPA
jgi:cholesterol oxidase